MEAWEIEFSPQEVFPLMLFAIFSVKISIFTTGSIAFDVRSHVDFELFKIFNTGSVPFDAFNHVESWEIVIVSTGSFPFYA